MSKENPAIQVPSVPASTSIERTPIGGSKALPQVADLASKTPSQAEAANDLERGKWSNPLDFVMSLIAFAVGLGNVWRFPYLAYKWGGGTFLVAYAVFFITVALPMMMMEAAMGQYMGVGATEIWKVFPILRGVGIADLILCFMVVAYYHVIVVWSVVYIISSFFFPTFPWEGKCHYWNTGYKGVGSECIDNKWVSEICPASIAPGNVSKSLCDRTGPGEFFDIRVLNKAYDFANLGSLRWELVGLMLVLWIVIYLCIWRSLIKARYFVWFSAVFPYVILFSLLICSLTLKGAGQGILAYVKPKPAFLLDTQLWKDAGSQVFFSYGIGNGAIISLGAYNNFNHNVIRDSIITCFVNGGTSIIAGFFVFATVGNLASRLGLTMEQVDERTSISGPGLAFKIYPEAVAQYPAKNLWAIGFFFMIFLLGLNSQVCMTEGLYTSIEDRFPKLFRVHRKKMLVLFCIFIVCISQVMITQLGELWLTIFDSYGAAGHSLLFVAFFEVMGIAWGFGAENLLQGIYEMRGKRSCRGWIYLWKFFGPLSIALTFIMSVIFYPGIKVYMGLHEPAPIWVQIIALLFSLASMAFIPGYAIYYMFSKNSEMSYKERFIQGITCPQDVNKSRVDKFSRVDHESASKKRVKSVPGQKQSVEVKQSQESLLENKASQDLAVRK